MAPLLTLLVGAAALPAAFALPSHNVRDLGKRQGSSKAPNERAQAVIDTFRFSWDGYKKYAWGHDELHPVSNTFSDSR